MWWGHVELRSVIKFCVGLGKTPIKTLKLIRHSETLNLCSVSVVYKWHDRFRNEKNQLRTIRGTVGPGLWKWLIKDKVTNTIYTYRKNVNQIDVLKQQSSNFIEMMLGHYISIQNFRDIFTVSQTILNKFIIIANYKDFELFLACSNFATLCCQGYL